MCVRVGLLACLTSSACFAEPPGLDGGSTSANTSSVGDDSEASSPPPSSDATSTSGDDSTTEGGSSTTGASTTDLESSSSGSTTGGTGIACECPAEAIFCDGFERYPGIWGTPAGGGGSEEQELDAPRCGDAAARTEVVSGDTYAVLVTTIPQTTGELVAAPLTLRTFVHALPGCAAEAVFVRLLQLQLLSKTGQWYAWAVDVQGGSMRLTASNHAAAVQTWLAPLILPDAWVELELTLDFSVQPPTAALAIDGEAIVESSGAPVLAAGAAAEVRLPEISVGPFAYGAKFVGSCVARYDEVSVAPD